METTIIQKKISMLGSFAVGKTSLVRRFVYSLFDEQYLSTIGVTISRRQVQIAQTLVNMLIWDLAGDDKFTGKQASYLQGTAGAFLVCDVTRPETFRYILEYRERLGEIAPNAQIVIVGNKSDIVGSSSDAEIILAQMAGQLNIQFFLTSAKTGANVNESFHALAQKMATGTL